MLERRRNRPDKADSKSPAVCCQALSALAAHFLAKAQAGPSSPGGGRRVAGWPSRPSQSHSSSRSRPARGSQLGVSPTSECSRCPPRTALDSLVWAPPFHVWPRVCPRPACLLRISCLSLGLPRPFICSPAALLPRPASPPPSLPLRLPLLQLRSPSPTAQGLISSLAPSPLPQPSAERGPIAAHFAGSPSYFLIARHSPNTKPSAPTRTTLQNPILFFPLSSNFSFVSLRGPSLTRRHVWAMHAPHEKRRASLLSPAAGLRSFSRTSSVARPRHQPFSGAHPTPVNRARRPRNVIRLPTE